METVVKALLDVVEHLASSHTFKSDTVAAEVRGLIAGARAALEPAPAAEIPAETSAAPTASAEPVAQPVKQPETAASDAG